MKVVKFGGTSLANAEQIKKVCTIILSDPERRIAVVSAPGKRNREDTKVTDMLIACADSALAGRDVNASTGRVIVRFAEIISGLGVETGLLKEIGDDLYKRLSMDRSNPRKFTDAVKAAGEDYCARIVASYMASLGEDAYYASPMEAGLYLSAEFGNAQVLPQSYENIAKALKDKTGVAIFPGFFGYTTDGEIVTFPRGGSDITGSILAAAVDAELYENFTDVDSVFAANPSVIDSPASIKVLTYREMRELSYSGFSVFHEEALEPVYRKGIPVCIKNTNNPSAPGTLISRSRDDCNGPVTGVACENGFCSITMSKYLMNREIGFGRKLLQVFEEEGLSYDHTPSGIDNISVILKESKLGNGVEQKVIKRIREQLEVDEIGIQRDLSLVMIVGEGMRHTVGITARATSALAASSVNIEMINQGASEASIMFGVLKKDADKAVKALYNEFFS